jgi:hypothetical protein
MHDTRMAKPADLNSLSQPQPEPEPLTVSATEAEQEAAVLEAYWEAPPEQLPHWRQQYPHLAELFDCLDVLRACKPVTEDPTRAVSLSDSPKPVATGDETSLRPPKFPRKITNRRESGLVATSCWTKLAAGGWAWFIGPDTSS